MTIAFDELFDSLGRIGYVLLESNRYQAEALPEAVADLQAFAEERGFRDLLGDVPAALTASQSDVAGIMTTLQALAENLVLDSVSADAPSKADTIGDALAELARQMDNESESVAQHEVTATATALDGNTGTGKIVLTTKRGDGLTQANAVAETLRVVCTSDAQTGGATAGQETFTITGGAAASSVFAHDWPKGSAASNTTAVIDPAVDATGNLLTNSDFETITANVPANWTLASGAAGTDILQETGQNYGDGSKSVEIVGGGTAVSLTQTFDLAAGTVGVLEPQTSYIVNGYMKVDVVPAAGVITIDLIDGSDATISDDQSVANSFTVNTTGLTTSYTQVSGTFRTPKALPDTIKIRIRVSTGISSGSSVFLDDFAMGQVAGAYAGGPGLCIFAGPEPFVASDGWDVAVTNTTTDEEYQSSFQPLFDRLFGMKSLNLLLPYAGGPSQPDSLIQNPPA